MSKELDGQLNIFDIAAQPGPATYRFKRYLGQSVQHLFGGIKIRETLREIDGAVAVANAGHAADDGIRKMADTFTELGHGDSS